MFKSNELWKHRNCTEIAIYVLKQKYVGAKYVKLCVLYYNRQATDAKNRIIDYRPETIKIKREDFKNWSLIE